MGQRNGVRGEPEGKTMMEIVKGKLLTCVVMMVTGTWTSRSPSLECSVKGGQGQGDNRGDNGLITRTFGFPPLWARLWNFVYLIIPCKMQKKPRITFVSLASLVSGTKRMKLMSSSLMYWTSNTEKTMLWRSDYYCITNLLIELMNNVL